MKVQENVALANLTSFGVGGKAERLIVIESGSDLVDLASHLGDGPIWKLGYGTNVLISDDGLPGTTLLMRNNSVKFSSNNIEVEAGVWWDDLVTASVKNGLWGVELLSGVPGSVGAAAFINISAYGQDLSSCLEWIEVLNLKAGRLERLASADLDWGYKRSHFQTASGSGLLITGLGLKLSKSVTTSLEYQSAKDVADELGLDESTLAGRREIILEARRRAGSIFIPNQGYEKTVGSFFKNPLVSKEQAEFVAGFDETGKTPEQIKKMSQVHGGQSLRASAAHVLLAAGFSRGQTWGKVRLHPKNLLKIENSGDASAKEIYDVASEIMATVKTKLQITLEAEAQILGKF